MTDHLSRYERQRYYEGCNKRVKETARRLNVMNERVKLESEAEDVNR